MNKRNQSKVWFDLAGMVSCEEADIEEMRETNRRNENVLDALAHEIKFESFTKSKLNVLPFHFEKEIKKNKSLAETGLPSLETFSDTLEKGKLLMETLEKYSDYEEDPVASEDLISELGHVCDELREKLDNLNVKHNTDFAAWLGSPHSASSLANERTEILEVAEMLRQLSLHLKQKSSIADSVNKVLDYQNKDLKKLSQNIPTIEVDENLDKTSLYLSVLSSSRAPAPRKSTNFSILVLNRFLRTFPSQIQDD